MQFNKSAIILKLNLDTFYIKSVSPVQITFREFNIFQIIYFCPFYYFIWQESDIKLNQSD